MVSSLTLHFFDGFLESDGAEPSRARGGRGTGRSRHATRDVTCAKFSALHFTPHGTARHARQVQRSLPSTELASHPTVACGAVHVHVAVASAVQTVYCVTHAVHGVTCSTCRDISNNRISVRFFVLLVQVHGMVHVHVSIAQTSHLTISL